MFSRPVEALVASIGVAAKICEYELRSADCFGVAHKRSQYDSDAARDSNYFAEEDHARRLRRRGLVISAICCLSSVIALKNDRVWRGLPPVPVESYTQKTLAIDR
jgi:hypothetical protein